MPYSLTQQQLSEILSITPVHVNRTLQGLRHDLLLDTLERSVMRILDWGGLALIGDFNSAYLRLNDGEPAKLDGGALVHRLAFRNAVTINGGPS